MKKLIFALVLAVILPFLASAQTKYSFVEFAKKLNAARHEKLTGEFASFADIKKINEKLDVEGMMAFMNSTRSQAKAVYALIPNDGKYLTPLEFTHFLSDDLFNRKALRAFIKEDQKVDLRRIMAIMDNANNNVSMTAAQLSAVASDFKIQGVTPEYVESLFKQN